MCSSGGQQESYFKISWGVCLNDMIEEQYDEPEIEKKPEKKSKKILMGLWHINPQQFGRLAVAKESDSISLLLDLFQVRNLAFARYKQKVFLIK